MISWKPVPDELSYGIAIYNFHEADEYKLKITVGDSLLLLMETEDWYYGSTTRDKANKGIFPKNYVHTKPLVIAENGQQFPSYAFQEPPIAHEIGVVLREWGNQWKKLYLQRDENFTVIKSRIYDLITHRSKIVSGTLPLDELKKLTKQATEEIDNGNKILKLDLVVRDAYCNLLEPETTSTIDLYNLHKAATQRINTKISKLEDKQIQMKNALQQNSNIFLVSVKNFTCKMTEDAELLMALYDGRDIKPITENYVVEWSKDGLMRHMDQMNNLKVMFTDLGKKDLEREKIYLVCFVIRVGSMENKEPDHRRTSMQVTSTKKPSDARMRRPFGVAAMDVTCFMKGSSESDLEKEYPINFFNCEKDFLEQTLAKIMSKDITKQDNKNQALFVSLKLLHGDLKQVCDENPHLVLGNVAIARKMGFPEVILPGDVRNDLYLTVVKGEFTKGNKTSDKNVQVLVQVCNEKGQPIPEVISMGAGIPVLSEYKSAIYYHEDKPHWGETFKVAIPIEEFKTSHLKFTFKHRSSKEAKDKSEKPFALCYVSLMQENGTTLKDSSHNLIVYKIDWRKFDDEQIDYLNLPAMVGETKEGKQVAGLVASYKDSFTISSNICSTKLTQNVDLLGLLNWQTDKSNLMVCLRALTNVDGEEVVKFLQDILDSLFTILMQYSNSEACDNLVFDCLLHIIMLVTNNWKYQHFELVLNLYIEESFSATLAYTKLIDILRSIVNANANTDNAVRIFRTMKCLQYVMRFISRSRILLKLYPNSSDVSIDDFEANFTSLLVDMVAMMTSETDNLLTGQGACLKYFPNTIPDILQVYDAKMLSQILCDLINDIPERRLTKQKMMTINDIVHSALFLYPECRRILLPVFLQQVKVLIKGNEEGDRRQDGRRQNGSVAKVAQLLGTTQHCLNQHRGYSEEVELCIKILSDILQLLFRKDVGPTSADIMDVILNVLRTVMHTHCHMSKDNPQASSLVTILIDIFRQMSEHQYEQYIADFKSRSEIADFLIEILVIFRTLIDESAFPPDWCEMILLQNNVILKALRFLSHTIRDLFFEKFDHQAWNNFFHCARSFLTQPSLQLEQFSPMKRQKILKRYNGDMRRETANEIRSMWFNLGQHKLQFVPSLVESILEMTLIPEADLRKDTIPIFFDMMQCEFYSSKYAFESYGDTKRDSSHIKGKFDEFEEKLISKLDILVEGGRGDEEYRVLFHDIMMERCSQHTTMHQEGTRFVTTVTRLLEKLLEYRLIITDENKENRMTCTYSLMNFYLEIGRKEMYIRYLNKLYRLHMDCENYTEAGYTLELYTKHLQWTHDPLPPYLKSTHFIEQQTHRDLKDSIFCKIIENFSKGKMWECAIEKCQTLADQFRFEVYDYLRLSELYKLMANFYEDIVNKPRSIHGYFRVCFYGKGFPQFLQNNAFIYRGKEYERLADFSSRILNQFPKAELLRSLTAPPDDVIHSEKQYVQINSVDPMMDAGENRFSGKAVNQRILQYYESNEISKFTFSRPFKREDPHIISKNDFSTLWLERTELTTSDSLPGVLPSVPVKQVRITEISPLQHAIEVLETKNKELKSYVIMYNNEELNKQRNEELNKKRIEDLNKTHIKELNEKRIENPNEKLIQIKDLSMKLNGILDPAVMGGIQNYEEVFFTEEYEKHHEDNLPLIGKLKQLIADQIPILELCVQIHKERCNRELYALQNKLENCLMEMKRSIVDKYGKGNCDIKINKSVTIRRHTDMDDLRLFEPSPLTDLHLENRSRVSSLTKLQVASLRQLTASFNFTASSPSLNSKSGISATKSMLLSPSKSQLSTPIINNKKSFRLPKEKREKRRSSKTDLSISPSASTQWYTAEETNTNGNPIELTQELTTTRPLRSEVERERRLSRPPSGQFTRPNSLITIRGTGSSSSSNRDSIGTTDSSISEEDGIPPPLPIKMREADSGIIQFSDSSSNSSFLYSARNSTRNSFQLIGVGKEGDGPPVPPPKPPKTKKSNI